MRSGILAFCFAVVLTAGVAAFQPQTSGAGSSTHAERLRTVETIFLEGVNQTQVFVRLVPRGPNGGAIAARVVLVALYDGNVTKPGAITRPPDGLTIQAQGSGAIFHVSNAFSLTLPGQPTIDLLAPPATVRAGRGCDDCGFTSLIVTLDPATLLALARSHGATANVLGMAGDLDQQDIDAIAAFARAVDIAPRPPL